MPHGAAIVDQVARSAREGIALFNRRQFFEAHEVWEDGWRAAAGEERLVLHGLIQIAAGFHKLQCGQPRGCARLLAKGAGKLAAVRGPAAGRLALPSLLASVGRWTEVATDMTERQATAYDPAALPSLPDPPRRPFEMGLFAHVEIDAPAERVWGLLLDFESYPVWNPFIVGIAGAARSGERLRVAIRPPGRRATVFRPRVLRVQPRRELRWLGRLILPGLLDGEHVFGIAPLAAARVRFSQRETFRGLLVPCVPAGLADATRHGLEEMNRALERRCRLTSAEARRI